MSLQFMGDIHIAHGCSDATQREANTACECLRYIVIFYTYSIRIQLIQPTPTSYHELCHLGIARLLGDATQCRVSTETLNLANELDNYTLDDWLIKEPFDSALHLRCSNKVKEWVVDMFILSCHGRLKAASSGNEDPPL